LTQLRRNELNLVQLKTETQHYSPFASFVSNLGGTRQREAEKRRNPFARYEPDVWPVLVCKKEWKLGMRAFGTRRQILPRSKGRRSLTLPSYCSETRD
jgi:hypothetical protein